MGASGAASSRMHPALRLRLRGGGFVSPSAARFRVPAAAASGCLGGGLPAAAGAVSTGGVPASGVFRAGATGGGALALALGAAFDLGARLASGLALGARLDMAFGGGPALPTAPWERRGNRCTARPDPSLGTPSSDGLHGCLGLGAMVRRPPVREIDSETVRGRPVSEGSGSSEAVPAQDYERECADIGARVAGVERDNSLIASTASQNETHDHQKTAGIGRCAEAGASQRAEQRKGAFELNGAGRVTHASRIDSRRGVGCCGRLAMWGSR